jgi:hypothetical protein
MATYGFREAYRAFRLKPEPGIHALPGEGWGVFEWDGLCIGTFPGWHPMPGFPAFASRKEAEQAARGCYRADIIAIDARRYVIGHASNRTRNGHLYWSNEDGWGDRTMATLFLASDIGMAMLPIDGMWLLADQDVTK